MAAVRVAAGRSCPVDAGGNVTGPILHVSLTCENAASGFARKGLHVSPYVQKRPVFTCKISRSLAHFSAIAWSYGALDPPRGSSNTNMTPFIV